MGLIGSAMVNAWGYNDADMDEVKTKKGGCGGAIGTTLAGMALLSVLAGAILITKKRKITE